MLSVFEYHYLISRTGVLGQLMANDIGHYNAA